MCHPLEPDANYSRHTFDNIFDRRFAASNWDLKGLVIRTDGNGGITVRFAPGEAAVTRGALRARMPCDPPERRGV